MKKINKNIYNRTFEDKDKFKLTEWNPYFFYNVFHHHYISFLRERDIY